MRGNRLVLLAWGLVVIELLLPVPGPLSLGAIYVLAVRPAWFARTVRELYGQSAAH